MRDHIKSKYWCCGSFAGDFRGIFFWMSNMECLWFSKEPYILNNKFVSNLSVFVEMRSGIVLQM